MHKNIITAAAKKVDTIAYPLNRLKLSSTKAINMYPTANNEIFLVSPNTSKITPIKSITAIHVMLVPIIKSKNP